MHSPAREALARSVVNIEGCSSRQSEETQMLTLKDCIDLSDLSDAEVAAIAEHEHVPEIVAAEIGCELINTPAGRLVVKRYIRENLVHARAQHMDENDKAPPLPMRPFAGSQTRAPSL